MALSNGQSKVLIEKPSTGLSFTNTKDDVVGLKKKLLITRTCQCELRWSACEGSHAFGRDDLCRVLRCVVHNEDH